MLNLLTPKRLRDKFPVINITRYPAYARMQGEQLSKRAVLGFSHALLSPSRHEGGQGKRTRAA